MRGAAAHVRVASVTQPDATTATLVCLDRWAANDAMGFIEHRESLMNAREADWFRGLRAEDFIAGRP